MNLRPPRPGRAKLPDFATFANSFMPDLLPMLPRYCLAGELSSHKAALARMLCLEEFEAGTELTGSENADQFEDHDEFRAGGQANLLIALFAKGQRRGY